ncbi:hypothetical protein GGS20DRAFT_586813 [Poronia punctata]|nr:hypothetical protein GGS20DRAFT_586813 [Poronia punctata]
MDELHNQRANGDDEDDGDVGDVYNSYRIGTLQLGEWSILDIDALGHVNLWSSSFRDGDPTERFRQRNPIGGTRLIVWNGEDGITRIVELFYKRLVDRLRPRWETKAFAARYEDEYGLPDFVVEGRSNVFDLGYETIERFIVFKPYLGALQKRAAHFFVEANKTPLLLLLPLLYVHARCLCDSLVSNDRMLRWAMATPQTNPASFNTVWCALRIMKHDVMRPLDSVRQYDRHHNRGGIQKSKEFKYLSKLFGSVEKEISRLETLARDYQQHHVAVLSLEESRASIKQAKVALEESKRTKLVTVLAIFFVPTSLSTAIFGMNIRELNEDGQPIWVFILTTVLVTAGTMMLWGFMYQFQKYTSLPKLPKLSFDEENPEYYTRRKRLSVLCQLVFRGHTIWAWRSGILLSLLTNGRVAFLRSCRSHDAPLLADRIKPEGHDAHHPCEYILSHFDASYADYEEKEGFLCSKLETIHDLIAWLSSR